MRGSSLPSSVVVSTTKVWRNGLNLEVTAGSITVRFLEGLAIGT